MSSNKSLLELVRIMIRWRWMIAGVVLIAVVASIIVALLLPNYFRSTAIIFPYNLATFDRVILFNTESSDKVLNYAGDVNDVERLISLANASPLTAHIVTHFNLAEHYGIDTTSTRWRYKVTKEFLENYKAIKTEIGNNVRIEVMDQNPQLAAEIANYIVQKVDEANAGIVLERNKNILQMIRGKLAESEQDMQQLTDQLKAFSDTTRADYRMLSAQQRQAVEDFTSYKTLIDQYEVTTNSNLSSVYVVERAYPAERKSKPVRWIIVVSTLIISLFLAIVAAIVLEKYKEIKYELSESAVA